MLKELAEFVLQYPATTGADFDYLVITEDVALALEKDVAEATPIQAVRPTLVTPDGETVKAPVVPGAITGKPLVVLIGQYGGKVFAGRVWTVEGKREGMN